MKCQCLVVVRTSKKTHKENIKPVDGYARYFKEQEIQAGETSLLVVGVGDLATIEVTNRSMAEKPKIWETLLNTKVYEIGPVHVCGGHIKPNVGVEQNPEWGGISCEMRVRFVCERCGCDHYEHLPHYESELNEWLEKIIEEMPDEELLGKS